VEAYERFYAEETKDGPPPPRPVPHESVHQTAKVQISSSSSSIHPKPVQTTTALSRESSLASSAGASLSRGDSMDATDGAGEFPAAESGKFFFYNPNAKAGERSTKKADKEEKKKKKKAAKVVDVGDGTADVDVNPNPKPKPRREKPKKSSATPEAAPETEDKKTAADMGSIVARLEEDRDDYLAAVKALSDLGPAPPASSTPFLHWTEYREIRSSSPDDGSVSARGPDADQVHHREASRGGAPCEGAPRHRRRRRHARASTLAPVPGRLPADPGAEAVALGSSGVRRSYRRGRGRRGRRRVDVRRRR
jgi:hypothetical protein